MCDESSNEEYVAMDFLAQAEHDPNASCVITVTSEEKAEKIKERILMEIKTAKRTEIIEKSILNSAIVIGSIDA